MPARWSYNINYWDRKPTIMDWSIKEWVEHPYQDCVLCPEHTHEIKGHIKGAKLSKAMDELDAAVSITGIPN